MIRIIEANITDVRDQCRAAYCRSMLCVQQAGVAWLMHSFLHCMCWGLKIQISCTFDLNKALGLLLQDTKIAAQGLVSFTSGWENVLFCFLCCCVNNKDLANQVMHRDTCGSWQKWCSHLATFLPCSCTCRNGTVFSMFFSFYTLGCIYTIHTV